MQRIADGIEGFRRIHLVSGLRHSMLEVALQHANVAMLNDSKFNFESAKRSYLGTNTLLSHIEKRSDVDDEYRRKLDEIVSCPYTMKSLIPPIWDQSYKGARDT